MTPSDLAEIRRRVDAATEGPWTNVFACRDCDVLHLHYDCEDKSYATQADALLMTHARTDVPRLLAEIERLRAALTDIATHNLPGSDAKFVAQEALKCP